MTIGLLSVDRTVSQVAAESGEVSATGSGVGAVAVGAGVAPVVGAEEAGDGAAVQPATQGALSGCATAVRRPIRGVRRSSRSR